MTDHAAGGATRARRTPGPGPLRRGSERDEWSTLLPLWALSRCLMAVVALAVMVLTRRSLHDVVSAWDVAHFETIASHGYVDPIDRAFFPGLPLLLCAAAAVGVPMGVAGVLLGAFCSFLAAWALLRIGRHGARTDAALRLRGPVAAGLWLLAPTTVFTTVGYTEAPFCAAAFWAWERGLSRRWGQAALLAALACSFRVSGLFLLGGLGLLALTQRGVGATRRIGNAALVALAGLVLLAYMAYLHHFTGSWNAWFEAQQSGWNRGFTDPLDSLQHTLDAADPARWPNRPTVGRIFLAEVLSMVVGTVLTVVLLVRRRWAEAGWVGVQVFAFATSYWFMSVNRAVLLWFPLWLVLGDLAAWAWTAPRTGEDGLPPSRALGRLAVCLVAAGSALVAGWWAWQYFTGAWAS